MPATRDEIGRRYGRLVVVRHVRDDRTSGGKKQPVYLFRCDCGNEHEARIYAARCGRTTSCGCRQREATTSTHGATVGGIHTPEYRAWRCMVVRGTNPRIRAASRYFLRGITVCAEWMPGGDGQGYTRFLAHVGPRPSALHTIDRKDNDRGYEPGNVRWATKKEQVNNRSCTVRVPFRGATTPVSEAAPAVGLRPSVVRERMKRLGWAPDRALTTPLRGS